MNRKSLTKAGSCFVFSIILGNIALIPAFASSSSMFPPDEMVVKENDDSSKKDDPDSKDYKAPTKLAVTSVDKIIQEALKYHPNIEADKHAFSATEDGIDQAKAGYLPTVDLRASLGRENIRRDFSVNNLSPLPSVGAITLTRSDPSVAIRQILFDGMGTASRVERARFQRNQARGTLGITTDTAMLDAATVAIDMRRLQRLLRIVDSNIQFHKIMKAKVAEIVEAGAAPISDLYQVEARLQDTYIAKSSIQSDLAVSQAKFIEVVGKAPPSRVKRLVLPAYLIPNSPEIAVGMALKYHNSIKVAKSNIGIATANYRESAAKLVPTITVEVEGERDRNPSGTNGSQGRITALIVARQNVFNGGADMAKSRETVKRLTESHARLNITLRQVERMVRSAWGERKSARAKSSHLTKLIREKRLIRATYLTEFTLGKRNLIDVLDAANDVFVTEASRTTADASEDIRTVEGGVSTGQFQKYISNKAAIGKAEQELEEVLVEELEPSLQSVSYPLASSKKAPFKKHFAKQDQKMSLTPISLRRKSIFKKRKEQRLGISESSPAA